MRKVLLCSGKVFYELMAARAEAGANDVAIVRLEQLYPFPEAELAEALSAFPEGIEVAWVQEEPANMGAMQYVRPLLRGMLGRRVGLVSRAASASPATGSARQHAAEQQQILREALA